MRFEPRFVELIDRINCEDSVNRTTKTARRDLDESCLHLVDLPGHLCRKQRPRARFINSSSRSIIQDCNDFVRNLTIFALTCPCKLGLALRMGRKLKDIPDN